MTATALRPLGHILVLSIALTQLACPDDPEGWSTAFDAEERGWFLSAWGPSQDHVFTVGGQPSAGVIMERTGETWSEVDLGLEVPLLNWVFGFADDDITVVGREGTVLHFDGTEWQQQPTPTVEDLWGVWGSSPSNLWAVGGRGRAEGQATILRYDGNTWTAVEVPSLQRPNVFAFFKVWGTGPDNVVIVGQRGVVLRWNGNELVEELAGASDDLVSVWGTGPDNIVAVGGRGTAVVARFDGSEWTTTSLAPLPGLNGVWVRNEKTIHAVGAVGTLLAVDAATMEPIQSFAGTDLDFHAVFGVGDRLLSVGGNILAAQPPYRGVAVQRRLETAE